jgi:hypothetical protein
MRMLRDEFLNMEWFRNCTEARSKLKNRTQDYNFFPFSGN